MTSMIRAIYFSGKPDTLSKFEEILPRLHSVVVGPGLGRDPQQLSDVEVQFTGIIVIFPSTHKNCSNTSQRFAGSLLLIVGKRGKEGKR